MRQRLHPHFLRRAAQSLRCTEPQVHALPLPARLTCASFPRPGLSSTCSAHFSASQAHVPCCLLGQHLKIQGVRNPSQICLPLYTGTFLSGPCLSTQDHRPCSWPRRKLRAPLTPLGSSRFFGPALPSLPERLPPNTRVRTLLSSLSSLCPRAVTRAAAQLITS